MTTRTLHPDYRALIELLTRHGVRFLIVGAHALAYHGRPRDTDDLDLLVEPSVANARAVADALRDFGGFETLAATVESHFTAPDRMISLGRPPVAIDLMTSISGVPFDRAWAGRVEVDVDGLVISFLGLPEYVANKKASARTRDQLDLELLEEAGIATNAGDTSDDGEEEGA